MGERLVRGIGFGDEEHAAGVAIQPVNDAGARFPSQRGELAEPVEQGVHEGSRAESRACMDGHSGWFVDGDHPLVFVENIQGDLFRSGVEGRRAGGFERDRFRSAQGERRFYGGAIYQNAAAFDPFLDPGTAPFRVLFVNKGVQPFPAVPIFSGESKHGKDATIRLQSPFAST